MRILKAVVILMGILIVVGLGVLIWNMYNISSKPRQTPVAKPATSPGSAPGSSARADIPALPAAPGFGTVSLGLPAGCDIAGADAASGRLVIRTSCGVVRILDLATGAPRGTVTR